MPGATTTLFSQALLLGQLAFPASPLPLQGASAVVWLEGPMGRALPEPLLNNCYVASLDDAGLTIICLD